MITWVFVMALTLPSYGGPLKVEITTTSLEACLKTRRVIVQQLGGEKNINGVVTKCEEKNARTE